MTEENKIISSETSSESLNDVEITTKPNENLDISKMLKAQKVMRIISKVLVYVFLTVFALFAIFPFYWMIISSLKGDLEYRESVPTFWPRDIQWENYKIVVQDTENLFSTNLVNTLVVGLASTLIGVIVTILTAFAFAKLHFKGKNLLFTLMLATMMIPGELFTTTNFITISRWQWSYTYTVMIVPFLVSIFYIYLLRNAFMQVPDSLYKAAKVDGTSDMKYLIKVMIPLALPTLVSITLLKFIGTWNSYIWPRLVNDDQRWQLLSNWVAKGFNYPNASTSETAPTLKLAAATMVSIPLLIVFICFRKYIMRGVSKSGTKG